MMSMWKGKIPMRRGSNGKAAARIFIQERGRMKLSSAPDVKYDSYVLDYGDGGGIIILRTWNW